MTRPTCADVLAAASDGRRRRQEDDAASAQAEADRPARQAAYDLRRARAAVATWRDTQLLARVSNFAWLDTTAVEVLPSDFAWLDTTAVEVLPSDFAGYAGAVLLEALRLELDGLGLTIEERADCVVLVFE